MATYSWRARIGMIKPAPVINTNVHEFYMMAPEGVELFVVSMGLAAPNQSEYDKALANLETPLRQLLRYEPDSIIQTGVPPICTQGWGFEEKLQQRISSITDVPFFSDVGACLLGFAAVSCRRIVMVSHSLGEWHREIADYLGHAGVEVVATVELKDQTSVEQQHIPLEMIYRASRQLYRANQSAADGIWITQASLPSVGVIEALERDLGCPVVTSAQATMWAGLRAAGVAEPIDGFGALMQQELRAD